MSVEPVRTRADRRAWIELPYGLYSDDPLWVPPLRPTERRRWSMKHNPTLAGRTVTRFLARRDGRAVGRIAAILDPAMHRWAPGAGSFGFFECVEDVDVAGELFRVAEATLRDWGLTEALGPVNLSTHDEVGFLVDGFDRRPAILDPYNPPWYPELAGAHGYEAFRDYHAYRWQPDADLAPAARRLLDRLTRRGGAAGVTVRSVEPDRWDEEVRMLHDLYNRCFADLWGFVPIGGDDFAARAAEFQRFYRPELILIASADEWPVGFAIALPDVNVALARAAGRLFPLGWLRLLRAVRDLRTARLVLLGVVPGRRGRGVAPLLAAAMHEAGRRLGIAECELSLVQGANDPMRHVIEAFDTTRIKTVRLYRKTLG